MSDVALRDYLENQIRALKEQLSQQEKAQQRALDLAAGGLLARFEQVNQFREQVLQERGVFVRRELLDSIYERLTRLELAQSTATGRWAGISFVAALVGAILGFVGTRLFAGHP